MSLLFQNAFLLHIQNYEKFLQDAQKTVDHLDEQEGEIHQSYGSGATGRGHDPQASPLEALRRHRFFQEAIMTVPTEVIRQGRFFAQSILLCLDLSDFLAYFERHSQLIKNKAS